ncbi:SRPBCC family protein [Flavobacterium phycosphaerae]|uniref:SRPBCC family protein n=1 Tax=Flavobacterium phycosphaerae TaxID=2697515 RepID=UPI001389AAD1|nr:SRPBCC family protein [Flavobacterium phycosphaerae]
MTTIRLITKITAPIQTVFDLARDIDVHQHTVAETKEKAIAGRTSGTIELGETVTFRGKHLGFYLKHQSKITEMEAPNYFVDEMEKGHFKSFRHEHSFATKNGTTVMIDHLQYEMPYGVVGRAVDKLVLKKYLT